MSEETLTKAAEELPARNKSEVDADALIRQVLSGTNLDEQVTKQTQEKVIVTYYAPYINYSFYAVKEMEDPQTHEMVPMMRVHAAGPMQGSPVYDNQGNVEHIAKKINFKCIENRISAGVVSIYVVTEETPNYIQKALAKLSKSRIIKVYTELEFIKIRNKAAYHARLMMDATQTRLRDAQATIDHKDQQLAEKDAESLKKDEMLKQMQARLDEVKSQGQGPGNPELKTETLVPKQPQPDELPKP